MRRQRKETILRGVSSSYTFRKGRRATQQETCKKGQRLLYPDVLTGPSSWCTPPSSKWMEFSSMMRKNKKTFHPCTNSASQPRSGCPINYAGANKHIWQHFEQHPSCTHITITSLFFFLQNCFDSEINRMALFKRTQLPLKKPREPVGAEGPMMFCGRPLTRSSHRQVYF